MCISPNFVWVSCGPKWEQQPVACRQCWRCKKNRFNDYVGRSLAEAQVSEHVVALNMTYADRDDLADKMVQPKHFQLFMKLLRRAGHEVRYIVAGEYGDLKGRAHFHAVLFFRKIVPLSYVDHKGRFIVRGQTARYVDDYLPGTLKSDWGPLSLDIPSKRMVHIREWPHGHVTLDWSANEAAVRYVCKYIQRDDKHNAWFSLSKKPTIGSDWFAAKAAISKELGVLPSSFEYVPPGGDRDRTYLMTGATRRDYLNAITLDDSLRSRMSEWVLKTFDKHARLRAMDILKSLPLALQEEAMLSDFSRREDQKAIMLSGERYRQTNYILDLLHTSKTGTLYYINGKWVQDG